MRFGRRKHAEAETAAATDPGTEAGQTGAKGGAPAQGPFDVGEVDIDPEATIDLGSLILTPQEGTELRLQVDEQTDTVLAAVIVGPEAALELRAFAAPRHADTWAEARPGLAAETARLGGTAQEVEGPFGTEVHCVVPVQSAEGEQVVQASRVFGINGPRWLLRATLMGRPAVEPEHAGPWEEAIRAVVVRRGGDAMPPGTPLPLTLPDQARRMS